LAPGGDWPAALLCLSGQGQECVAGSDEAMVANWNYRGLGWI